MNDDYDDGFCEECGADTAAGYFGRMCWPCAKDLGLTQAKDDEMCERIRSYQEETGQRRRAKVLR